MSLDNFPISGMNGVAQNHRFHPFGPQHVTPKEAKSIEAGYCSLNIDGVVICPDLWTIPRQDYVRGGYVSGKSRACMRPANHIYN